MTIPNLEGHAGFDVHWAWEDGPLKPGLTGVFRVRNEARNLPWVLPPMFEAVDRIVLVDNQSDDGTAEVARRLAQKLGAADRLTVASYPFDVARAGAEHLATPPDSVHSLTHFYNWSMAHVETGYSMKWDGDMVLTREGSAMLADLAWQLEDSDSVVAVPRHPLTVESDSVAYIDFATKFIEPWVYPMGPETTFVKAFEWEVREFPETSERIVLPEGLCVELKWLDSDEFAHWSSTDFTKSRSPRKRREWQVDRAIREGRGERLPGVIKIVAPPGIHVVDYVTETWLPLAPRPLVRRGGGPRPPHPLDPKPEPVGDAADAPAPRTDSLPTPARGLVLDPDTGLLVKPNKLQSQKSGKGGRGKIKITDPVVLAKSPYADRLARFMSNIDAPVLVLLHPDSEHLRAVLPQDATVVSLPADSVPGEGRWGTILLAAPDRDALRRIAPALPPTRGSTRIGVWLDEADRAVSLMPRADWPLMTHLHARRAARLAALTLAIFGAPVSGHVVLAEIARQCVAKDVGNRGLRVAVQGDGTAPPGDVNALRIATVEDAGDPERDVPPDVVMTAGPRDVVIAEHPVIGRAPMVVDDRTGPLALGPLDERILNPVGFGWVADDAVLAEVEVTGAGHAIRVGDQLIALDKVRGATEALVRELRPARGVTLAWPEEEDRGLARTVAGLAMTGVPLVSAHTPDWAQALLGPAVSAAITAPVDLADRLAREEHSVVQRRAGLGEFASSSWRAKIGALAGVSVAAYPPVSVVLATKRPENLDFALRQVRRQRGIDLELVLAPHGFEVDEARVREVVGDQVGLVIRPQGADVFFGDVLSAATEAANGDLVLKMDDDDWYGPDAVADLVLARTYSGADLVGMAAEFLYLEPRELTVRRGDKTEMYAKFVAGGTMLIEKGFLRSLGGFRKVRKYVDATLLSDVLGAGGAIYRTQGLGYVFRRGDTGHTWEADVDFFLDPERLSDTWDGFTPSRLLEAAAEDLPSPAG